MLILEARPPFPLELLLRDALYLLQGIDGRYILFARRAPRERNPYATETARAGDGIGFPLGKGGKDAAVEDEEDVVGIEIVADEAKVSRHHSILNRS
jgi:gamma-tubulin complex component 3